MSNMIDFASAFGHVRAVQIDGEPWFVGKDVTDILGYKNGSRDIDRHVDEEDRGYTETVPTGGNQSVIIINESGVYSLAIKSKLETAKPFRRWITSEVIPSIRKTGGYGQINGVPLEELPKALITYGFATKSEKLNRWLISAGFLTKLGEKLAPTYLASEKKMTREEEFSFVGADGNRFAVKRCIVTQDGIETIAKLLAKAKENMERKREMLT